MTEFLKNSLIFSYIKKISDAVAEKWNKSQTSWYVTRNLKDIKSHNSVLFNALNTLINKTFSINIGGAFGNKVKTSVFLNLASHYEIGVYLMLFLAPIIPTMACVALSLLTILSFFIHSVVKNDFDIKIDAFGLSVIVLTVLFLIYSVTSYASASSIKVFMIYAVFIAFMFVVISCGTDKKRLKNMVFVFVLSGFFVSAYGIYQNFYGSNVGHAWIDEEMFSDISVRVYSTLGNPNVLGEYLILLIPICGAMVYGCEKFIGKIFYFGVMACAGVCLIFTQSRGCWLGIILIAIIFAFLVDKRLVLLGVLAILVLPFVMPESIINRFLSIGNLGDSSTSYRVNIWLGTIEMLKDYWWMGIGIGTDSFNKVYPFYSYSAVVAQHSHNLFLQIFAETGISGLLTFITGMLIALKKIIVGYIAGKKNLYSILCASIFAGLLGFFVQGMFDNVWYNHRIFAIFWIVIGIGMASRRCACGEDNTHNQ